MGQGWVHGVLILFILGAAPRGQVVATSAEAPATAADSQMFAQAMQDATAPGTPAVTNQIDQSPEYWLGVQQSLMGSQWAHKYRTRAISVIAMLDPAYSDDPTAAEQRVGAVLRPAVVHRHGRHGVVTRQVSATKHRAKGGKAKHGRRARRIANGLGGFPPNPQNTRAKWGTRAVHFFDSQVSKWGPRGTRLGA